VDIFERPGWWSKADIAKIRRISKTMRDRMDEVIDHRLYDQGTVCGKVVGLFTDTQSVAAVKWFMNKVKVTVQVGKNPLEELSYTKPFVAALVANQTMDFDIENGGFLSCCTNCGFFNVCWTCRWCQGTHIQVTERQFPSFSNESEDEDSIHCLSVVPCMPRW